MKRVIIILLLIASKSTCFSQSFTLHKHYNSYCGAGDVIELSDSSLVIAMGQYDSDTITGNLSNFKSYLLKIKNGNIVDSLFLKKDSISPFFPTNKTYNLRYMFSKHDTIFIIADVMVKYIDNKYCSKTLDSVTLELNLLTLNKDFNLISNSIIDSNLCKMYATMSVTHDDSSVYIWSIDPFQNMNTLFTKANLKGEKIAQNTNKHYDYFNRIGFVNGKIAVTSYNYKMYYMYDPNTLTVIDSFCIQSNSVYDLIYPVGGFYAFRDSLFVTGGYKCDNYNCDELDAAFVIFNSHASPIGYQVFGVPGTNDGEQASKCLDFINPDNVYYVTTTNSKYPVANPQADSTNYLIYYRWNLDVNPPQLVWSKQYGGDAEYRLVSMKATKDGGLFMVVSRRDMPVGSRSPWDLLFIKTDANGNFTSVIENHQTISDLKIYPNPGNGIVRLSGSAFENNHRKTIRVFDMNGKMVFEQDGIALSDFNINLGNQPVGIYLVQLTDNRLVQSVKYQLIR